MTIAKLFGSCNNIGPATKIFVYTSEDNLIHGLSTWEGLMVHFPDRETSLKVDVFRINQRKNWCDIVIYPDWRREY